MSAAHSLQNTVSRRQALKTAGAGFGYLALAGLLGQNTSRSAFGENANKLRPLAPKKPHFAVKAKRVIFLFMQGHLADGYVGNTKPSSAKRTTAKWAPAVEH